jgi:hypothetical protein
MSDITNPIDRTSKGLANMLFDEIANLRAGITTPSRAHATAKLARTLVQVVRLELDFKRFSHESAKEPDALTIPMGGDDVPLLG